jgi:hypothetical protein
VWGRGGLFKSFLKPVDSLGLSGKLRKGKSCKLQASLLSLSVVIESSSQSGKALC